MIVAVRLYVLTADRSRFPHGDIPFLRAATNHVVVNCGPLRIGSHKDVFHLLVRAGCVWFKCHIRYCIPPFLIEKGRGCIILWDSRTMQCPAAVIFDLDATLAESFRTPSPEILEGLQKLLERMPVAIMTGTGFQRMEDRFLPALAAHPPSDWLYI